MLACMCVCVCVWAHVKSEQTKYWANSKQNKGMGK